MQGSIYASFGKRLFDFAAALMGLLLLAPVLFFCSLLVGLSGPGGIIFKHSRVGRNFVKFNVYKFRTMAFNAGPENRPITIGGDSRITRVGRLLRKTKLDELPQLFNVLLGDMSIVGPRPEVEKYVEMFRQDYEEVLSVRPGITDFAAIAFRDEEGILARYPNPETAYVRQILPAKIRLYKKYVLHQSLISDFVIIVRTIVAIFLKS